MLPFRAVLGDRIRHDRGPPGRCGMCESIQAAFHIGQGARRQSMWETRSVNLNIRLPRGVAAKAEAIQASDPEFLSRVLIGGLTRRSIYEHLKEHEESLSPTNGEVR